MKIEVQLFGENGKSTTEVKNPGGLPTRHIRLGSVSSTGETLVTIKKEVHPQQTLQELLQEVDALLRS